MLKAGQCIGREGLSYTVDSVILGKYESSELIGYWLLPVEKSGQIRLLVM